MIIDETLKELGIIRDQLPKGLKNKADALEGMESDLDRFKKDENPSSEEINQINDEIDLSEKQFRRLALMFKEEKEKTDNSKEKIIEKSESDNNSIQDKSQDQLKEDAKSNSNGWFGWVLGALAVGLGFIGIRAIIKKNSE